MNDSTNEPNRGVADDLLLDELATTVFRVGRLMVQRHGPHASGELPNGPQTMLLRIIDAEGPLRVSDIAHILGVKNPAASMLLSAMTSNGLVERTYDPGDRRAVLVSLSEAGRRQLDKTEETQRMYMRRYTADLTPEEIRALVNALNTLIGTVERENNRQEEQPDR